MKALWITGSVLCFALAASFAGAEDGMIAAYYGVLGSMALVFSIGA
jgi:hypothetical protein